MYKIQYIFHNLGFDKKNRFLEMMKKDSKSNKLKGIFYSLFGISNFILIIFMFLTFNKYIAFLVFLFFIIAPNIVSYESKKVSTNGLIYLNEMLTAAQRVVELDKKANLDTKKLKILLDKLSFIRINTWLINLVAIYGGILEPFLVPFLILVVSYNEIVPGHMNLDKITQAVKMGVAMAGGTPIMVPAIAVCDGIAMGHIGMKYSLVTRDLIADSTEALAMAHQFDGLVMIPNCDKNVPGLLMAAARVNIPTIFVSGGPMLAGHVKGSKTSLSSMFEAVGSYAAGKFSEEDVCEFEEKACPTCGSCSGMYTANSMNCLTEALGMGLKGNGTIPAVYSARLQLAKHAGMQVMELVRTMSLGRIFFLTSSITCIPACFASCSLAEYTAGMVPFPFSPIPRASVRQFILFAVYIPEQEPQVGHAFSSNSHTSSSENFPAA